MNSAFSLSALYLYKYTLLLYNIYIPKYTLLLYIPYCYIHSEISEMVSANSTQVIIRNETSEQFQHVVYVEVHTAVIYCLLFYTLRNAVRYCLLLYTLRSCTCTCRSKHCCYILSIVLYTQKCCEILSTVIYTQKLYLYMQKYTLLLYSVYCFIHSEML